MMNSTFICEVTIMPGNFRNKLYNFMLGRYGIDEFGKVLNVISIVLCIVSFFIPILTMPTLLIIFYEWFRILSRNHLARAKENQWFLKFFHKIGGFNRSRADSIHKIFKCPNCHQKIRVPRGKGKISIRCPKCGIEFIRRT